MKNAVTLFLFLSIAAPIFASDLEKGFDALNNQNYFEAKKRFENSFKRDTAAAAYGLATIFYLKNNPFHSLDSAYKYVLISEKSFFLQALKTRTKWKKFGVDSLQIELLKLKISNECFQQITLHPSVEAYSSFVSLHPWSEKISLAIYNRDSLAYQQAVSSNLSTNFDLFLVNYPNSSFAAKAKSNFDRLVYLEYTRSNKLEEYENFIANHPTNHFYSDAEDRIYESVTAPKTIESYITFVLNYPENKNRNEAWRRIHKAYMAEADFSPQRIEQFKTDYPDYPFSTDLEEELKNMSLKLFPFEANGSFGYMDHDGNPIISAEYQQVGFFKEGLASAMKNNLLGFINKSNQVVVPFQYTSVTDFDQGRATVEIDGKLGAIDRSGKIIFPLIYTDLGTLSEGLIYGNTGGFYTYFDRNNVPRITGNFTEAYDFNGGMAKVQIDSKQAYIDTAGKYVIAPKFPKIRFYTDSIVIFEENEKMGLMLRDGTVILLATYDQIGTLSFDRSVSIQGNKMGYLDGSGKVILPPIYEVFPNCLKRSQFHSGLALVRQKEKFGAIDVHGKLILPFQFLGLGELNELTAFTKGKGWGFIHLTAKISLQPSFDEAQSFQKDIAIVSKTSLYGVVDKAGALVIPIEYSSIDYLSNDLLLVSKESKMGIFALNGEKLVPIEYDKIRAINDDLFVLNNGNKIEYLYLPEKKIIQLKE